MTELRQKAEAFQREVDAVVRRAASLYPSDVLFNVRQLVDHGEPVEGLCSLAWVIVARDVRVPQQLIDDIDRLTVELRAPGDLPENLGSFALVEPPVPPVGR